MTQRRSRDWLIRFIVSPSKMIESGDPTALELLTRFRGLRMPELGLTETDAEDVITFVETGAVTKEMIGATPAEQTETNKIP